MTLLRAFFVICLLFLSACGVRENPWFANFEEVRESYGLADAPLLPMRPRRDVLNISVGFEESGGDGRFIWPASGYLLATFGAQEGGLHNDGVNIALPPGSPVRAIASGRVVYVGNELKGYGNLLLIAHADDWVSAYAHNREILVRRGDTVDQGDVVARSGSSGNVVEPQLHFELRRGSDAVDPMQYMG
ncbi:MAG: M23 family metallopeptidase [Hyphomicrobiales bacterium]|nr:M23 family metallopeptidase [Hyphomicrobiales bacterium]